VNEACGCGLGEPHVFAPALGGRLNARTLALPGALASSASTKEKRVGRVEAAEPNQIWQSDMACCSRLPYP
jgi:hypothetical protein